MEPGSLLTTLTCRDVLTFFVVILGQMFSGSLHTFNLTMVAIKEKFNFTQTEVELVTSSVTLGVGAAVPVGVLFDRCGPKMSAVVGLGLVTPGLGLMYIATLTQDFFYEKAWLLAVIAFIAGLGIFVTFITSWTTGVRQAGTRVRGICMGIFKSLYFGSPAFFTLIYDAFFKKNHVHDAVNQDVGSYILFLLISFIIVDILIISLFRNENISHKERRLSGVIDPCNDSNQVNAQDNLGLSSTTGEEEESSLVPAEVPSVSDHTPLLTLLKDPTLHLLTWTLTLTNTCYQVIYTNIPVITESVDLQTYTTELLVVCQAMICLSALLSGIFLNLVKQLSAQYVLLTSASVAVLFSNILFLITTKHIWVLFMGCSVLGLGTGMSWLFGAGLMFSYFGSIDYGRNWAIASMMTYIVSLSVSLMIGKMYDRKVSYLEGSTCVGEYCTRDWFILLGCLSVLSVIPSCVKLTLMCFSNRDNISRALSRPP